MQLQALMREFAGFEQNQPGIDGPFQNRKGCYSTVKCSVSGNRQAGLAGHDGCEVYLVMISTHTFGTPEVGGWAHLVSSRNKEVEEVEDEEYLNSYWRRKVVSTIKQIMGTFDQFSLTGEEGSRRICGTSGERQSKPCRGPDLPDTSDGLFLSLFWVCWDPFSPPPSHADSNKSSIMDGTASGTESRCASLPLPGSATFTAARQSIQTNDRKAFRWLAIVRFRRNRRPMNVSSLPAYRCAYELNTQASSAGCAFALVRYATEHPGTSAPARLSFPSLSWHTERVRSCCRAE